jgi:hypothetical protein
MSEHELEIQRQINALSNQTIANLKNVVEAQSKHIEALQEMIAALKALAFRGTEAEKI